MGVISLEAAAALQLQAILASKYNRITEYLQQTQALLSRLLETGLSIEAGTLAELRNLLCELKSLEEALSCGDDINNALLNRIIAAETAVSKLVHQLAPPPKVPALSN
jgi:hypothetical protein